MDNYQHLQGKPNMQNLISNRPWRHWTAKNWVEQGLTSARTLFHNFDRTMTSNTAVIESDSIEESPAISSR